LIRKTNKRAMSGQEQQQRNSQTAEKKQRPTVDLQMRRQVKESHGQAAANEATDSNS